MFCNIVFWFVSIYRINTFGAVIDKYNIQFVYVIISIL